MGKVAILLFLSDYKEGENQKEEDYYYSAGENDKIQGVQTNDAPVKYLLQLAAEKFSEPKNKISIVCITSNKVKNGDKKEEIKAKAGDEETETTGKAGGEKTEPTAYTRFQEMIEKETEKEYLKNKSIKVECHPVEYEITGQESDPFVKEEIETKKIFDEIKEKLKDINDVYIDYTGGLRNINFLMTTIVRYLEFTGVNCQKVVYSERIKYKKENEKNRLHNITYIYEMFQLINGVNEFLTTGNAAALNNYLKSEGDEVKNLMDNIIKFSNAMSICDVSNIDSYLKNIKESIGKIEKENSDTLKLKTSMLKELLPLMRDRMHLDDLGKPNYYVKLIRWCEENNMLQQALTLIEDKMPEIYMGEKGKNDNKNKVLLYEFKNDDEKKSYLEVLGPRYETNEKRKIFYHTTMNYNTTWNYLKNSVEARRDIKTLKELKNNLNTEDLLKGFADKCTADLSDDDFIKHYCEFRRLEDISSRDSQGVFKSDYGSILKWCKGDSKRKGNEKNIFEAKQKNKPNVSAELQIEIHEKIKKGSDQEEYLQEEYLEETLLLHSALKKERNCCNHASDRGVRLSADIVKRAIKIYIERVDEILKKLTN